MIDFKAIIEAISVAFKDTFRDVFFPVALALFSVYVAHLLSKNRERVKEYENVYSLLNGICVFSKKIVDIVEASKKEYKKGEYISAPLQSFEILNVCSEELLNTYKKDVDSLEAKRLFDPDSVIAVLNFKLHFELFVKYVLVYMDFNNKMDPDVMKYTQQYYQDFLTEMKLNRSEEAYKSLAYRDEMLVAHFNGHCNSILTQFRLLVENKNQVGLGLRNAKSKIF